MSALDSKVRIHRTWHWRTQQDGIIGAQRRWVLMANDELQMRDEASGEWIPVPIVEGPKPEHPDRLEYQQVGYALGQLSGSASKGPPAR